MSTSVAAEELRVARSIALRSIWIAVLHQAWVDAWDDHRPRVQAEARVWINTRNGFFDELCLAFDIHPDKARHLIASRPHERKLTGFSKGDGFGHRFGSRKQSALQSDGTGVGFHPQQAGATD